MYLTRAGLTICVLLDCVVIGGGGGGAVQTVTPVFAQLPPTRHKISLQEGERLLRVGTIIHCKLS